MGICTSIILQTKKPFKYKGEQIKHARTCHEDARAA